MSEPHNFTCKVQLSKWTCNQKAPSGANMFANTFDSNLAGASFELMTPSPMLAANRFADLPARPGYPKNLHLILRYGNREGKDRGVLNWTCRVKSRTRRCRIWTLDSFFPPSRHEPRLVKWVTTPTACFVDVDLSYLEVIFVYNWSKEKPELTLHALYFSWK